MKGFILVAILSGFALGLLTAAWLGRYQLHITSTGQGVGFAARLDRWTGRVEGMALMPNQRTWSTWTPRTFSYEEAQEWEKLGTPAAK